MNDNDRYYNGPSNRRNNYGRNLNLDPARARDGNHNAQRREKAENKRKKNKADRRIKRTMVHDTPTYVSRQRRYADDNKYEKMRLQIASGMVATLITLGIVNLPSIAPKAHDLLFGNSGIERIINEYDEVLHEALIGRTDDNARPNYNYRDIAEHIIESGNFDDGLYGTYKAFELDIKDGGYFEANLGERENDPRGTLVEELDKVLRFTEFETFDNYLTIRGYEDIEDYEKDMERRIKKEEEIFKAEEKKDQEIAKMQDELEEMSEEHPFTDSNGGRAL